MTKQKPRKSLATDPAGAANPDETLVVDEVVDEDEASVAYDIASYPSDLTLSVVNEMWSAGDIVIPEFQRNFVWSIKQSSLLIESFLVGLPVPQVFFYVDEANKSLVIDGLQRIVSVVYFLSGFFGSESIQGKKQVFRLQGLAPDSPFGQKRFEDLPETSQRKLRSAVLRAINIRQLAPKGETTSIFHIFERLNTGGTPLKAQEIRNCVFRGGLVRVLRQLNEDDSWRRILGKVTYDRHQKDVELVLRVFALTYFYSQYEKPLKEFLNRAMASEQDGQSQRVQEFAKRFKVVAKAIVDDLGDKPFHVRGPLNASALDATFAVLMNSKLRLPADLKTRFTNLVNDDRFRQTTFYSTSDRAVVEERFRLTEEFLLG